MQWIDHVAKTTTPLFVGEFSYLDSGIGWACKISDEYIYIARGVDKVLALLGRCKVPSARNHFGPLGTKKFCGDRAHEIAGLRYKHTFFSESITHCLIPVKKYSHEFYYFM